jgi:prophage regulatory protein
VADVLPLRVPVSEPAGRKRRRKFSPFVVDARRLARLLCAGLRTVRCWDTAGKLPAPLRIGGRVVWRVDEIRDWLAAGAPNRDEWEVRCHAVSPRKQSEKHPSEGR